MPPGLAGDRHQAHPVSPLENPRTPIVTRSLPVRDPVVARPIPPFCGHSPRGARLLDGRDWEQLHGNRSPCSTHAASLATPATPSRLPRERVRTPIRLRQLRDPRSIRRRRDRSMRGTTANTRCVEPTRQAVQQSPQGAHHDRRRGRRRVRGCVLGGRHQVFLGLTCGRAPYRISTLRSPSRLVVDFVSRS